MQERRKVPHLMGEAFVPRCLQLPRAFDPPQAEAFRKLEDAALAGAKQRRRRRYLITRFGAIRFFRWQTRTDEGYGYPLDETLGLEAADPCSAWVRETAAWLAQAHPYRQAARLLSKMIGTRVDHRTLWGWVQGSGRRVRRHLEQQRSLLFDDGQVPQVEVKLGIWWCGAHLQSPTATHPKHLLQGKGAYASTEGADRFGQTFYAAAAEKAGIANAKEVFFVSDGAGWLADLPADWIAPTAIQLDQFHGKVRISEVARDPDRAARWWAWVTEHNLGALSRSIDQLTRTGGVEPEAGRELMVTSPRARVRSRPTFAFRPKDTHPRWLPADRARWSTTST